MINNKITKKIRHVINLRSSIDSNIVLNFLINIVSTFECYQKRQSQRNTNNVHHIMLILTNFSRLNKHFICLPHIWYLFSKDKITAVHYLLPKQWINNLIHIFYEYWSLNLSEFFLVNIKFQFILNLEIDEVLSHQLHKISK